MSSVRILVSYEGEWVPPSTEPGVFKFSGTKVKGMLVPKNIKYKGLSDKVHRLLSIDPRRFSVGMKVLYASSVPVPPAEVATDDDVAFFIGENSSKNASLRTPLCVTLSETPAAAAVPEARDQALAGSEESVPEFCAEDEAATSSEELAGPGDGDRDSALDRPSQTRGSENPSVEWVTTREDLDAMRLVSSGTVAAAATPAGGAKEILAGSSVSHSGELELRQTFSSKKELKEKLSMLAIKESFEYRVKRSSSKLLEVRCIEEGCEWELRAIVARGSAAFRIKKLGKAHSCSKESRSNERNRQATTWVIGQHIKSKCLGSGPGGGTEAYKPREIIEVVRKELGINLSYAKAWRVKVTALDSEGGAHKRRAAGGGRVGRPKKQRVVEGGGGEEDGSARNKCGNCGEPGHYRQTCPGRVDPDPVSASGGGAREEEKEVVVPLPLELEG